jgi:hypothetical protein
MASLPNTGDMPRKMGVAKAAATPRGLIGWRGIIGSS